MNRRKLLSAAGPAALALAGASAGAAVHVAAASVPDPDAELIALCAQLDALERAYLATDFATDYGTPADDVAEAERERIAEAQQPIVDAICACPPCTLAGAAAVAHSLALWDAELLKKGGEGHCTDDRLLAALVRGLTGHTPTVPPAPSPDAALLALCAAYHRHDEMSRDEGNFDPVWEAAADARHAAFKQIMPMVPVTEAGHRAKAAVAVAEMDDNRCDGEWMGDTEALFALNVLKDWLGVA